MFKKLVIYVMSWVNKVMNMPEFVDEIAHVSWADFEEKGKPNVLFYSINGCPVCEEIQLWLSNNWIPHKIIKCRVTVPALAPKIRNLVGLIGFKGTYKKIKNLIFLHQKFPQIDLLTPEGTWTRHVGNSKIIRSSIEDFIQKYVRFYPGFEAGVYGDKAPAEQAAAQMADVLNLKTKGSK